MTTPAQDDPIDRARRLFTTHVEDLDPATATALRVRRREALASVAMTRRQAWWWPAGGLATAALALAVWLPRGGFDGPASEPASPTVAIAPAAPTTVAEPTEAERAARFAEGALDELENDAEFYEWLATLPADNDVPALPPPDPQEG